MRKIKKLVATLLAATMLLAMGVTAFAATPTTCKFNLRGVWCDENQK